MMRIPYPRECRNDGDGQGDTCYNAHGQYSGVIFLRIDEEDDQPEY
jgi:hypothetical protein